VSAVELQSKDFVAGVAEVLGETGYDPRHLELEITETFLMQDSKSTAFVLQALKQLGVKLALDDFGTGYSSLSYMRRFPVDALKVDRSFVRDLITHAADAGLDRRGLERRSCECYQVIKREYKRLLPTGRTVAPTPSSDHTTQNRRWVRTIPSSPARLS
jgi:hypothetical protein